MTAREPDDPLRPPLDPHTLQEVDVDVAAVAARADALEGAGDAAALAVRAGALRLLGRLEEAEEAARHAVDAAADPAAASTGRRALGQVLADRRRFGEAEAEFAAALADAAQAHDEQARADALEDRGRSRFAEGRVEEAERDFTAALQARRLGPAPPSAVARLEAEVAAAVRRLIGAGHR